jgi:hypothetical protein
MAKKSDGPNGPSVSELRAMRLFARMTGSVSCCPVKVTLGTVAMWNALTKKVVDLKSPTLGLMQKFAPDTFKELVESPRPVAMGDAR